jgi:lipoprotein NlpI
VLKAEESKSKSTSVLRLVGVPESQLVFWPVSLLVIFLSLSVTGCTGFRAARLYQEGTASLDSGHPELAVVQLSEASNLQPDASEIQNHLGLAFAATGQHDKALSAFERAVDLDCTNEAATQNLASAEAAADSRPALAKTETVGESADE